MWHINSARRKSHNIFTDQINQNQSNYGSNLNNDNQRQQISVKYNQHNRNRNRQGGSNSSTSHRGNWNKNGFHPQSFLKALGKGARTELLTTFNHSFNEAECPQEWRNAIIIPLFKAGRPANQIAFY